MKHTSLFLFELKSTARRGAELLQAPLFLLMGAMCFPLASNPQAATAQADAILWVLLLLSNLMTQHAIWDRDARDGVLEQMLLYPISNTSITLIKFAVYWLCYSLPLLLILPIIGLLLGAMPNFLPLLLGSILLSIIGFLTATLTISEQQSPVLRSLLSLPLYIPVLIFGAGSNLLFLGGMVFIYIPITLAMSVLALRFQQ